MPTKWLQQRPIFLNTAPEITLEGPCVATAVYFPRIAMRRAVWPDSCQNNHTLSVGSPICPYGIVYRRVYGLPTSGLFAGLRNVREPA